MKLKILIAGLFITALLGTALTVVAQQGAAEVFGETIDVPVINVEAVVTEGEGQRVQGLGPEDFQLRVDGRRTSIEYFTEVRGGRTVERGEGVGTHYLVFISDELLFENHRNRPLERLVKDLEHLGPHDQVAIVAFDSQEVSVLTDWTGDPRETKLALASAMTRPLADSKNPRTEIRAAITALRSFGSAPGRKVALLLVGDWPFEPVGEARYRSTDDRKDESGRAWGAALYSPLVDTANLLGYTLYPVDISEYEGINHLLQEEQTHDAFRHIASQTGGKALLDDRGQGALEHAAQDTRSYYRLGFAIDRSKDGKVRQLDVELNRPGVEARARKSYRDVSREDEVAAHVDGLLLFPDRFSAAPLPLQQGQAERGRRRTAKLPITLGIPAQAVTFFPRGKIWTGDLKLRITILDDERGLAELPVIPLHLETPEKPPEGALLRYDTKLTLRLAPQALVIALHDPLSGELLASRIRFDPKTALRGSGR